jgi:hypothetical protein
MMVRRFKNLASVYFAFAGDGFTVNSSVGVIVCFAKLSVTDTSSLYLPGAREPSNHVLQCKFLAVLWQFI